MRPLRGPLPAKLFGLRGARNHSRTPEPRFPPPPIGGRIFPRGKSAPRIPCVASLSGSRSPATRYKAMAIATDRKAEIIKEFTGFEHQKKFEARD